MAKDSTNKDKWSYSVLGGIVFLLLSLPCVTEFMRRLSVRIAGEDNANTVNLVILTVLYICIIRMMMW